MVTVVLLLLLLLMRLRLLVGGVRGFRRAGRGWTNVGLRRTDGRTQCS